MTSPIARLTRFVRTSVLLGGGGWRSVAMAIHVWRAEGWAGIRWRLKNARGIVQGDLPATHAERTHLPKPALRDLIRLAAGTRGLVAHTHDESYCQWVRRYDQWDAAERQRCHAWLETLPQPPRLTIGLALRVDEMGLLSTWMERLQRQPYPHWAMYVELVAQSGQELTQTQEAAARLHGQLEGVHLQVIALPPGADLHQLMPSAAVLQHANGGWLLLPSPATVLHEAALPRLAAAIAAHPQAQMVYGDEDRLDAKGQRHQPHFKPAWNYDLLLSTAYIGQAFAIQHEALAQLVWPDATLPRSAWWLDMQLQCAELSNPPGNTILHTPWILCHQTQARFPMDAIKEQRRQTREHTGREQVLNGHWARTACQARAYPSASDSMVVRYALPSNPPWVTLIVPTRNREDLLRTCISSIVERTDYPRYDILVIDNASDEPGALAYLDELRSQHGISVIRDDRPFNFSSLNNHAVTMARGEFVGFINNDIETIDQGWLTEMVSTAMQPGVGAVGARLLFPDQRIQHAGVILGVGGLAGHSHKFFKGGYAGYQNRVCAKQSLSAVTAACLVLRTSSFLQVGGFNESDLAVAYNDVDLCLKLLEAGFRNVYAPQATLLHHESVSRGEDDTPDKRARFKKEQDYMLRHWQTWIQADPAYSPNLTIEREDFSLAWPPRVPAAPWCLVAH